MRKRERIPLLKKKLLHNLISERVFNPEKALNVELKVFHAFFENLYLYMLSQQVSGFELFHVSRNSQRYVSAGPL